MLLLNVLLALAWVALTGQFTPANLAFGFVLGYVMLWVAQRSERPTGYFTKVGQVVRFAAFFLWEMIKADLITTLMIGIIAVYAIGTDEPVLLDLAIVLALISFLGTVAFAHYIERRV